MEFETQENKLNHRKTFFNKSATNLLTVTNSFTRQLFPNELQICHVLIRHSCVGFLRKNRFIDVVIQEISGKPKETVNLDHLCNSIGCIHPFVCLRYDSQKWPTKCWIADLAANNGCVVVGMSMSALTSLELCFELGCPFEEFSWLVGCRGKQTLIQGYRGENVT